MWYQIKCHLCYTVLHWLLCSIHSVALSLSISFHLIHVIDTFRFSFNTTELPDVVLAT